MLLSLGHLSDAGTKVFIGSPIPNKASAMGLGCEFLGDHWSTLPVPQPLSTKAVPSSLTVQAVL